MSSREDSERTVDRERLRLRAEAARQCVARLDPSLLDTQAIDVTLHDLTLARSVLDRLDDAYRHELGNAWLRGLERGQPPGHR